jgi:hypothetical protein
MAPRLEIVDNQNGTWTANALLDEDIVYSEDEPGEVTIHNATVVYLDAETYTITHTWHDAESRRRLLQDILVELLGSPNVYFQPPPDLHMLYPCIAYERDDDSTIYADNSPYKYMKRYKITVMDRNPDSLIPDKVRMLPFCKFDRFFAVKGLNHDVFTLYH